MPSAISNSIGPEGFAWLLLITLGAIFFGIARKAVYQLRARVLIKNSATMMEEGKHDEGLLFLEKACKLDPTLLGDPAFGSRFADLLIYFGQYEKAVATMRKLVHLVPAGQPGFPHVVDQFASFALSANWPQLFEEAEKHIRRVIQHHPDRITIHGTLGSLLVEQGKIEDGRAILSEVHSKSTSETDRGISAAYLSMLANRDGKMEAATRLRDEARQSLPGDPLIERILATT